MFTVWHRGHHLGWACLRCHRFHGGCEIWHPPSYLLGHSEYSSTEMETLACQGGGLLHQFCPVHWEMTLQGLPSGYCFFCPLILLRPHQALTKCPNHYFSRNLLTLGWPWGSCLLTSSGGGQSQPEGSKGLALFHFHISVKLLTVFRNPGKSPYQHLGWLAPLSRCLGPHLE